MNILRWMWHALAGPRAQPVMPELPNPSDVPTDEWDDVVTARSICELKPWPNLPDEDYLNTIIGTCDECGRKIYGGQGFSCGWSDDHKCYTRCGAHSAKRSDHKVKS